MNFELMLSKTDTPFRIETQCFHCGDDCINETITFDHKSFCCNGCKSIYQLFQGTELEDFYRTRPLIDKSEYDYLDNEEISNSLIKLKTEKYHKVQLNLPAIHCSSCLYVLENLYKIEKGILKVTVNFANKTADILFDPRIIDLAGICGLLAGIGYKPDLSRREESKSRIDRELAIKIGVAGFCFGNIMLISFPEYLGIDIEEESGFSQFFGMISIVLSLPILFYSGRDYFRSAITGIKNGFMNIDIPIALGMVVLFTRSSYEIFSGAGAGYLDSLAGLVFFLLIGRWFQSKTYEDLSFDRDYTSYFPLSVIKLKGKKELATPIQNLKVNDIILIRNEEIVPADSILLSNEVNIDYSFVTGEKDPVVITNNQLVYAGGRLVGNKAKFKIVAESSQSYLSSLWNNQVFKTEKHSSAEELTNKISKHFTAAILIIAVFGALGWYWADPTQIWQVVSAILIVACPCALALSAPFTNGNTIRILGRNSFFLKKASVSEKLPEIDTIIFDKTGTITSQQAKKISFIGDELSQVQRQVVKSLTSNSTHPLSKMINASLDLEEVEIDQFKEASGKGISARYEQDFYWLGSASWVGADVSNDLNQTKVFLKVNTKIVGHFIINHHYRKGVEALTTKLGKKRSLMILSGDNDGEREVLANIFPEGTKFYFNQKPGDKLEIIKQLQQEGHKVMMVGDGLNDAGALMQSDLGLAVTDDITAFTPACDGIIKGDNLVNLSEYLEFGENSRRIIYKSFGISFLYNIGGMTLALMGLMTPIAAAILMPLSSISVVLFTTLSGNLLAKRFNL